MAANKKYPEYTVDLDLQGKTSTSTVSPPGRQVYFVQCNRCQLEIFWKENSITTDVHNKDHTRGKCYLLRKYKSMILEDLGPNYKEGFNHQYFAIEEPFCSDENFVKVLRISKNIDIVQKDIFVWCKVCNWKLPGIKISDHLGSNEHKKNVRKMSKSTAAEVDSLLDDEIINCVESHKQFVRIRDQNIFECRLCSVVVDKSEKLKEHVNSENHRKLVDIFNDVSQIGFEKNETTSLRPQSNFFGMNAVKHKENQCETSSECKIHIIRDLTEIDTEVLNSLPSYFDIEGCEPNNEISLARCIICDKYLLRTQSNVARHSEDVEHKEREQRFLLKSYLLRKNPLDYSDEYPFSYYYKDKWPNNEKIIILREVLRASSNPQTKIIFWCTVCDFSTYDIFSVSNHLKGNHEKKLPSVPVIQPDFFYCDVCNAAFRYHTFLQQFYHFHKNSTHLKNLADLTGYVTISVEVSAMDKEKLPSLNINSEAANIYKPGDEVYFLKCKLCTSSVVREAKHMIRHCTAHNLDEKVTELLEYVTIDQNFDNLVSNSFRYFFEGKVGPDNEIIFMREVSHGYTISEGSLTIWCKICDTCLKDTNDICEHIGGLRHQKGLKIFQEIELAKPREAASFEGNCENTKFEFINWKNSL